jgi:hypothetical protein
MALNLKRKQQSSACPDLAGFNSRKLVKKKGAISFSKANTGPVHSE